jgi:hypothetical protein
METLTIELFNKLPNNEIFASGIVDNSPEGIFMNNKGGKLKWIAKKGLDNDWAISYSTIDTNSEWIGTQGRKVYHDRIIKKYVPCNDEVFNLYKY